MYEICIYIVFCFLNDLVLAALCLFLWQGFWPRKCPGSTWHVESDDVTVLVCFRHAAFMKRLKWAFFWDSVFRAQTWGATCNITQYILFKYLEYHI